MYVEVGIGVGNGEVHISEVVFLIPNLTQNLDGILDESTSVSYNRSLFDLVK